MYNYLKIYEILLHVSLIIMVLLLSFHGIDIDCVTIDDHDDDEDNDVVDDDDDDDDEMTAQCRSFCRYSVVNPMLSK